VEQLINRKPVVSGKFYPANNSELTTLIENCFLKNNLTKHTKNVRALIAPHAGYIFSGEVAASAFMQLNRNKEYKNIFILAPSHQVSFNGASIYNMGNYETPLGTISVNINLANELINSNTHLVFFADAHKYEHSLEVQLPFLQYWLKKPYNIIPIVIGDQKENVLESISETLLPYFNGDNLFVISSDFSHFPNYNDAVLADSRITDAILSKNITNLDTALKLNKTDKLKNLATSACGLSGIKILMHLINKKPHLIVEKIKYMNSGDSPYGDKERVVGYGSFCIIEKKIIENIELKLNESERQILLTLARLALKKKLKIIFDTPHIEIPDKLYNSYGVFVSLHKGKELRGCIGQFETREPLHKLIKTMAVSSGFNDSRFKPLKKDELNDLSIEISVLSPLKPINDINEIVIGKHGIYIKKEFNKGTLLPQVATNNNWNIEEFLGYCSKYKAGIGWEGWKNADIYIYTAEVFSD